MTGKERWLWFGMHAAGAAGLAVALAAHSDRAAAWIMAKATAHGDLYRFAKVARFKLPMPPRRPGGQVRTVSRLQDADVCLIGDSFSESAWGHDSLARLVAAKLGTSLWQRAVADDAASWDPSRYLEAEGVSGRGPRLVIVERVERYLVDTYAIPSVPAASPAPPSRARRFIDRFDERWERLTGQRKESSRYELVLRDGPVTAPFVEAWCTLAFMLFGRISEETPVYSLAPPTLFYYQEVNPGLATSFSYPHDDALVASMAGHLARIARELRERHGAELLFVPVPNKVTIDGRLVTRQPYDGFLPRLCAAAEQRGVRTVRLYEPFAAAREPLYLPGDSHWNSSGAALAAGAIARAAAPVVRGRGRGKMMR